MRAAAPFRRCVCLAPACLALALARPAAAQLRGMPVFFDPTYSFDTRVGLDIGHGGEADGLALALGATHLFLTGNCKRVALSGGAGTFNPPGEPGAGFNAGVLGSVLLNPCPFPTSIANPTLRAFAGAGLVRVDGSTAVNVPVGVGAGYLLEFPIARIELWATPRVHFRERIAAEGSTWDFAVSGGLDIGAGGIGGVRVALDCCEGGLGAGYGLSLWF